MTTPTLADLPTPETLPDDPGALRAIIVELLALIARQAGDIEGLEHRLRTLLRRQFGPKADRVDTAQLLLFASHILSEQPAADELAPTDEPALTDEPAPLVDAPAHDHTKKKTKRGGNKRKPLPAHLPRERVIHRPPEADEPCPCCGTACVKIGEETTETLDVVPASFRVIQDVREKYACPGCRESGVAIAELPPRPLHRGRYGPGFIAWVIVSKYADHLPLYRLVRIAKRSRIELAISTLIDLIALGAMLLGPIVEAMRRELLGSPIIHTDDTRMPVIIGRGSAHSGRIRVYVGVDDEETSPTSSSSSARPAKASTAARGSMATPAHCAPTPRPSTMPCIASASMKPAASRTCVATSSTRKRPRRSKRRSRWHTSSASMTSSAAPRAPA